MKITTFGIVITKEIELGDSIFDLIINNLGEVNIEDNDIIMITHKVISKSEGREVQIDSIDVSERALKYSKILNRSPQLVQLMLNESKNVIWAKAGEPFLLEHKTGVVCANAGVDLSNSKKGHAICLPIDSDKSAEKIRVEILKKLGKKVAVGICDSQGRPYRNGSIGVLLGSSNLKRLKSYIGSKDRNGRVMQSAVESIGDEFSSMANLIMGQARESIPVVLIRGMQEFVIDDNSTLVRDSNSDIFLREIKKTNNMSRKDVK